MYGLEEPGIALHLGAGLDPLEALEEAVRPALERPPCVVSFSGGRDSSCVLAVATRLARREALDLPVPVSVRFPGAASADEASWQELIVGELQLADWEKAELEDGDFLGSAATDLLRRHGPLWPGNAYVTDAVIRAAPVGGSLLTGLGGDEIFGGWRWRPIADALARRRPLEAHDLLRAGYASLPRRARLSRERRRAAPRVPGWLQPAAREESIRLAAELAGQEPIWWQDRIRWRGRRRNLLVELEAHELLGSDRDKQVVAPMLEPVFLAALARAGGRLGFGDRTDSMLAVFDSVAPESLLRRRTKATGADVFWVGNSRKFADAWDGAGVDHALVDPAALRREWLSPTPAGRSVYLLHLAWLHAERERTGRATSPARTGSKMT